MRPGAVGISLVGTRRPGRYPISLPPLRSLGHSLRIAPSPSRCVPSDRADSGRCRRLRGLHT